MWTKAYRAVLVLMSLALPASAHAGRLDDAGDATRDSGQRKSSHGPRRTRRSSTSSSSSSQLDCESCESAIVEAMVWLFTSPWRAPYRLLEGDEGSLPYHYADRPYADDEPGLWRSGNPDGPFQPGGNRFELQLEGAYQVDNLARGRVLLRWRTPSRLEPTVEWLGWLEPQPDGIDLAMLGQYGLSFRFAQRQGLSVRSGLRLLQWQDSRGPRLGGVLTYGIEAFPRQPWTLAFDFGLGGVGGAFYGRARATVGYVFGTAELYAGYDHVVLRSPNHRVRLTGPVLGVRLWF